LRTVYTVAGRAVGFALEQPLHVVALACSASGILNSLSIQGAYTKGKYRKSEEIEEEYLKPLCDFVAFAVKKFLYKICLI
jgi:hypothetical protein